MRQNKYNGQDIFRGFFYTPIGECAFAFLVSEKKIISFCLPEESRLDLLSRLNEQINKVLGRKVMKTSEDFTILDCEGMSVLFDTHVFKPEAVTFSINLANAIEDVFLGEKATLQHYDLYLDEIEKNSPFFAKVYRKTREIKSGTTVSYGEMWNRLISTKRGSGARSVGQAMAKNPFPILVPCHRVVKKEFKRNVGVGGFSSFDGTELKSYLLELEGVDLS